MPQEELCGKHVINLVFIDLLKYISIVARIFFDCFFREINIEPILHSVNTSSKCMLFALCAIADFPCMLVELFFQLKQELRMIVEKEDGELLKDWPTWRKKILAYGKLEAPNRPSINSLLAEYDATTASEEFHDGTSYTCIVMMIIC